MVHIFFKCRIKLTCLVRHVFFTQILDCHIFCMLPHFSHYFGKVRISHIFPAYIGILAFDSNFNILCVSICINIQFMRIVHGV